jgi:hypothetical protein
MLKRVLAKLSSMLTGDQSAVCEFVQALATACEVAFQQTPDGVFYAVGVHTRLL